MKKLLLAGTAALLTLSTSAHADPYEAARAHANSYQDQRKAESDKEYREYEEREKERAGAEAKRQMELARQLAEAQRRAAETQAKIKAAQMEAENQYRIWFSKPENKLLVAYDLMHRVQFCRQVRDGYLVINISEPEYDRATTAVKAIEKVALQAIPDLNTDNLWKQGEQRMYQNPGFGYNSYTCKQYLQDLYNMSPTSVYEYQKP